jgi:uncharacterized protein YjbI with pentapeptide repeats
MASEFDDKIKQILTAETTNFLELARMVDLDPSKDFIGSDLSNINLEGADLQEFNFTGADLSYANLSHANLSYANLSHSDLRCAKLQESKLTATDFSNADLRGVEWGNSDIRSASFYGAKADFPLPNKGASVYAKNDGTASQSFSATHERESDISLDEF